MHEVSKSVYKHSELSCPNIGYEGFHSAQGSKQNLNFSLPVGQLSLKYFLPTVSLLKWFSSRGPYRYVPRDRVWFLEILDP